MGNPRKEQPMQNEIVLVLEAKLAESDVTKWGFTDLAVPQWSNPPARPSVLEMGLGTR